MQRSGAIPDIVPDCNTVEDPSNLNTICDPSFSRPADPGWGTGLLSIVARHFIEYGDVREVQLAYPAMVRYVVDMLALVNGTNGLLTFTQFGDWYPPFDGIKVGTGGVEPCCPSLSFYTPRFRERCPRSRRRFVGNNTVDSNRNPIHREC